MIGRFKKLPMTGTLLRNCTVAGMKPPNKSIKPYVSMIIPIKGYPIKTTMIPAKNAIVALTLCFWKKKLYVRWNPIMQVRPQMKSIYNNHKNHCSARIFRNFLLTFPIANKPRSKISKTPRKRNATPKPAKPTPISENKNNYKRMSNLGQSLNGNILCVSVISNIF